MSDQMERNNTSVEDLNLSKSMFYPAMLREESAKLLDLLRMKHDGPFVDGPAFNGFIGCAVFFNALLMGLEVDYNLGIVGEICEHLFTTIWTIEMFARLYYAGLRRYLGSSWNRMDCLLAWLSIFDVWILPGIGLRMLSILRVLRMMKIVRMVKVLRSFTELWLLVNGLIQALAALSWVVILLMMIVYVSALFMYNMVGQDCNDVYVEFPECHEMFGTMLRAMYTLFQVITLESWSMAVARPVIEEKPWLALFFVAFLYLTTFGLMNIVMGVIVEQVIKSAEQHEDKLKKQKELAEQREINLLRDVFLQADEDGSGDIGHQEFVTICEKESAQLIFEKLELPVPTGRMALRLFEVLDADGDGHMPLDEFLAAAGRLKNEGRLLLRDPTLLLMSVRHLDRRLNRVEAALGRIEPLVLKWSEWMRDDRGGANRQQASGTPKSGTPKSASPAEVLREPSLPASSPQHCAPSDKEVDVSGSVVDSGRANARPHHPAQKTDNNTQAHAKLDLGALQGWLESHLAQFEARCYTHMEDIRMQLKDDLAEVRLEVKNSSGMRAALGVPVAPTRGCCMTDVVVPFSRVENSQESRT